MQTQSNWRYVKNTNCEKEGYFLWKHTDGVWQVTKTNTPPTNDAGYYDLNALLKLKGI